MPPRRTTRAATRAAGKATLKPAHDASAAEPSDPDADPGFLALPRAVRRRVDAAFDRAARRSEKAGDADGAPPRKRRRVGDPTVTVRDYAAGSVRSGGGFLVDDAPGGFIPAEDAAGGFLPEDATAGGFLTEDAMAGGFLPEPSGTGGFLVDDDPADTAGGFSPSNRSVSSAPSQTHSVLPSTPASLALSAIPAALLRLGLPTDDPDVLRVFENAASGWSSGPGVAMHSAQDPDEVAEKGVSRKDWRAVCAVLLEGAPGDDDEEDGDGDDERGSADARRGLEEDDDDYGSDVYVGSGDDDADEDAMSVDSDPSDDDYGAGSSTGKARRQPGSASKPKTARGRRDGDADMDGPLTGAQEAEVRRAFGLFFDAVGARGPIVGGGARDVPPADVDARPLKMRRLGIREVDAAAKLLKEKLTAEDIVEMLALFSGAPDKTLSLEDFGKMMRTAGLV